MICQKCGAQVPQNAKFCPKCGSTIMPPQPPLTQVARIQPPQRNTVPPVQPRSVPQQPVVKSSGPTLPKKKKHSALPAVCIGMVVLLVGALVALSFFNVIPVRSMFSSKEDTAGRNLEWVIEDDTLFISGTGTMWNWTKNKPAPWNEMKGSIRHIVISAGVSNIGGHAFSELTELESIVVPSTVTEIEETAFEDTAPPEEIYYEGTKDDWEKIELPEELQPITPSCDTEIDSCLAYQAYLEAAETLMASGAWSESMDTDIWLTAADGSEMVTSVDYEVQISGYKLDDTSETTVNGSAHIRLSGDDLAEDVTEFTFSGNASEIVYHYTLPEKISITSNADGEDGSMDCFFSSTNRLKQNEVTYAVKSDNAVKFGISAEILRQLIGDSVGEDENVVIDYTDSTCSATATIDPDTGKLASLRMEFLMDMTVADEPYSAEYSVYLWFGEYVAQAETESGLQAYVGEWEYDSVVTLEQTGKSGMDLFGSSVKYGTGMTIEEDGTFAYHYPLGGIFRGTCKWENGTIAFSAMIHEGEGDRPGTESSDILTPCTINGEQYLKFPSKYFDESIDIYWKRCAN